MPFYHWQKILKGSAYRRLGPYRSIYLFSVHFSRFDVLTLIGEPLTTVL